MTEHNAPPMEPVAGAYDDEMKAWPKVIGIISIVLAALGLTCGTIGVAWMFIQPGVMGQIEGGVPPEMTTIDPVMVAATVLGVCSAVFLLVSGAMLVGRKPVAAKLHLIYAAIAIVLAIWGTMLQLDMQADIAQWVKDNPDAEFAKQQQATGGVGNMIGLAISLVLSFSWPLFCLLWFGVVKRGKTHEITQGMDETL